MSIFSPNIALDTDGSPSPTADNKPVVQPNLFPPNVVLYFTGAGDDIVGNTRGNGTPFLAQSNSQIPQDIIVEWGFLDWVLVAGGGTSFSGGQNGDYVSFMIFAPATPVVPTPGVGNCNVVGGVIIPAPGNGDFTVDLTQAIPIPSLTKTGFFECTDPDIGKGVVSIGVPGQSTYLLIAAEVPLAQFLNRFQVIGERTNNLTVPAIAPKKVLPQWKFRLTLHNIGSATPIDISWYLLTARVQTV